MLNFICQELTIAVYRYTDSDVSLVAQINDMLCETLLFLII